jgi:hypothetical protein
VTDGLEVEGLGEQFLQAEGCWPKKAANRAMRVCDRGSSSHKCRTGSTVWRTAPSVADSVANRREFLVVGEVNSHHRGFGRRRLPSPSCLYASGSIPASIRLSRNIGTTAP